MDYALRNKEGTKAAFAGIIGNIILTIFNISIGMISGSFALIAEGAHTLSDVATSIIAYIGFKIGQKPADAEHPLGHGRAEAISGLIIVIFLAFVAYEIITGAIDKLLFKELLEPPTYLAGVMAAIGIVANLIITKYQTKIGNSINSPAIIADAKHQKTDIFSCIAILISVIIAQFGYTFLDPLVGLIIGVFILKVAYNVGKDNINNIMGKIPSKDLINDIKRVATDIDGVYGVHNIKLNYFGSYATLALHVEVDPNLSLKESHDLIHYTQNQITKEIDIIQLVIAHACPFGEKYELKK
ncbi:cation diffusion facilitator family transporter [Methanobrevibacter cuticularis]|uniref:cation diffusion facilitator family transporter n=1 Tax=Methanobrevibacter cuticularis TaxID=47311 RepID=UPI000835FB9B|nr:cation diffusion facilitator family transporter [Methanobrevibacter cuticularis]